MLFNVSDEEFTTSKEIDLNIIDLNLPATLLHEFSNPTCDDSCLEISLQLILMATLLLLKERNIVLILAQTQTQAIGDDFGFQHNGSSCSKWNQNNIYLIMGG